MKSVAAQGRHRAEPERTKRQERIGGISDPIRARSGPDPVDRRRTWEE